MAGSVSEAHYLWDVAPGLSALLSLTACLWLLVGTMRRVTPKHRRGLLLRQLWHIALADCIQSVGTLAICALCVALAIGGDADRPGCGTAQWIFWCWSLLGTSASMLTEAHFTLGLLAAMQRWQRIIKALKVFLPTVWAFAPLMAFIDAYVFTNTVWTVDSTCHWVRKNPGDDLRLSEAPLIAFVGLFLIATNCWVYVWLAWPGCGLSRPGSIETRFREQCKRYVLVAIFTWVPYWIVALCHKNATLAFAADPWQAFSACSFSLSGAFNIWVYAAHNRRLKLARSKKAVRPAGQQSSGLEHGGTVSRHVAFDSEQEVREMMATQPSLCESRMSASPLFGSGFTASTHPGDASPRPGSDLFDFMLSGAESDTTCSATTAA